MKVIQADEELFINLELVTSYEINTSIAGVYIRFNFGEKGNHKDSKTFENKEKAIQWLDFYTEHLTNNSKMN